MIDAGRPEEESNGFDRRGQLLLVGAVVLAIIILGLSVVVNTVLFTENVGTGEARVEAPAIEEFSFESQKSARSLMLRLNAADRTDTIAEVDESISDQISAYSDATARSYAASGTVFVDIEYSETLDEGTRIVQGTDRKFTYPASGSDEPDWDPVNQGLGSVNPANLGWMVLNVNLRNTSGDQATLEITSEGGENIEYRFNRSDGGNGPNLRVNVSGSTVSGTDAVACGSVSGRVLLDLRTGQAFSSDCTFEGINEIDGPYERIRITNGDNLAGQYDIIVNENDSSSESIGFDDGSGPEDWDRDCTSGDGGPCISPVVWQGQIDLAYRSADVNFGTVRNITVYDP